MIQNLKSGLKPVALRLVNDQHPNKKRRSWFFWTFVLLNIAGIIIAIPLLSAVFPLLNVWWDTRSEANFHRSQERLAAQSAPDPATPKPTANHTPSNASAENSLSTLTNHFKTLEKISDDDIGKILEHQFGSKRIAQSDPATFHKDSAVFHSVRREIAEFQGRQFYCYEIDLVDQNGNHKVHVDCFEKPDLDYERTIATLELVNSNPQLKKIYAAFSQFNFSETSEGSEAPSSQTPPPVFRIEEP